MTTTASPLERAGRSPQGQQGETPSGDLAQQEAPSKSHIAKESFRLAKRWRKQALPLAGMTATHGIGAASAALTGSIAVLPVLAGWGAAAGAYGYARPRTTRGGRIYAGIAAIGSALFQAGIGAVGGNSAIAAAMWIVGTALSLPWWAMNSEPEPDITAEKSGLALQNTGRITDDKGKAPESPHEIPAAVEVRHTSDRKIDLWNEYLSRPGTPLAGSTLDGITEFQYGWKATVTVAISEHWGSVFQAKKVITSVYDLPDGRVFIESLPGESARKCQMTILQRDPLQEITRWAEPGLDHEEGSFPLMVAADGQLLNYQLWHPTDGAMHGLISGGTRSGKSKVLDVLLAECAASDRVIPMVVDGGGGASLPHWMDRAHLFATGLEGARQAVRYACSLMENRRPILIRQGGGSITPSPDHPLIPIVIDEAHKFLMVDKKFRRQCEIIAQEGAKFGIGLHLATQVASVTQLGGSGVLRDQLKSGTVVGLRVSESTSETMISSGDPMPEKLRDLPAQFPNGEWTRGLGYVMTGRKIRSRSLLLENPREVAVMPTQLEPELRNVPVPAMTNETSSPAISAEESGEHADQSVMRALEDGTRESPMALMQETGLSLGEVRGALKRLREES